MPHSVFSDPDLPRWELATTPLIEIGGTDEWEGYALGSVSGAVLLEDRLAIADASFGEVRFYALSGDLLGRSGRTGSGPGEYRAIRALAAHDDSSVVVWDVRLSRLTRLSASGQVLTTISPDLSGTATMFLEFVGILEDGRPIFRENASTWELRNAVTGERRDSIQFLVLEPDGAWRGDGWKELGTEVYFTNDDGALASTPIIFGRSTLATMAAASLVVGFTDTLRLIQRVADGTVRRTATLAWACPRFVGEEPGRSRGSGASERSGSRIHRRLPVRLPTTPRPALLHPISLNSPDSRATT